MGFILHYMSWTIQIEEHTKQNSCQFLENWPYNNGDIMYGVSTVQKLVDRIIMEKLSMIKFHVT